MDTNDDLLTLSELLEQANALLERVPALASTSPIEERTLRYWVQERLLPRLGTRGPGSHYPRSFAYRLVFIRMLQQLQALTLEHIRDVLARVEERTVKRVVEGKEGLRVLPDFDADEIRRHRARGEEMMTLARAPGASRRLVGRISRVTYPMKEVCDQTGGNVKIGKLVKRHIKLIFSHCDNVSHKEFDSLLDPKYSKKTFRINFPFCIEVKNIEPRQLRRRYWTEHYLVRGRQVQVTNDWYEKSRQPFIEYLRSIGIKAELDLPAQGQTRAQVAEEKQAQPPSSRANSRYRGNHIGNAQNHFIRNLLSNLGQESFGEEDWNSTKKYFSGKCVYCGELASVIDHAMPINREQLGEHRLGNLVPSCKQCNQRKGGDNFRVFLEGKAAAIGKIEKYMDSRNYVPLADNEQIQKILNMAHKEVAALADRYITIVNELFSDGSIEGRGRA